MQRGDAPRLAGQRAAWLHGLGLASRPYRPHAGDEKPSTTSTATSTAKDVRSVLKPGPGTSPNLGQPAGSGQLPATTTERRASRPTARTRRVPFV